VIAYRELVLLLNSADGAGQLDALASLLNRGLVRPILDGDSIVGLKTTSKGDATLKARTLPTAQS
jgi:hypothetical protein